MKKKNCDYEKINSVECVFFKFLLKYDIFKIILDLIEEMRKLFDTQEAEIRAVRSGQSNFSEATEEIKPLTGGRII